MDLSMVQRLHAPFKSTGRPAVTETLQNTTEREMSYNEQDRTIVNSWNSSRVLDTLSSYKVEQPCYINEVLLLMARELFDSWRHVGTAHRLTSDTEIAIFLIEHYKKTTTGSDSTGTCARCQSPLTLVCLSCDLPTREPIVSAGSEVPHRDFSLDGCDDGPASPASPLTDMVVESEASVEHDALLEVVSEATKKVMKAVESSKEAGDFCNLPESQSDTTSFPKTNKAGRRHVVSGINSSVKRKVGRPRKNSVQAIMRTCQECGAEFPTLTALRQHQRKLKHGSIKIVQGKKSKVHKCRQCKAVFDSITKLREHHNIHAKRKPHKCDHCPASFSSRNNLIAHVRKHTGERPYKCEHCDKAFARNTTLIQHMRIHTNERPFKCDQCDEAFKQRGQLIIHKRKHTGEKPFKCSLCSAAFIAMGRLTAHMVSHSGLRPYLCEECGASFAQKGILKAHIQTHTGERPFSCDQCGKRFYRNNDLRAHKRTHSGVRDIVCMVCGQAFLAASNFRRHMQKHTGYRPHPCQECGKFFASKSELKVHTRIHTGDKPYLCQECGRGFITRGNMMKHYNNRHRPKAAAPPSSALDLKTVDTIQKIFHSRPQKEMLHQQECQ